MKKYNTQPAGWCICYMLILIMKMKHSANYVVHTLHVNINNGRKKIYIYIYI